MASTIPSALVPIANGTEEIEAVVIVDILRRAKVDVCVASVEKTKAVTASRGVKLEADVGINDCKGPYDMIALPVLHPSAVCHLLAFARREASSS
jgi:4-methyl-5(b-hydroxyethyl)-thiazole monophosphate biosynthesis